MKIDDICGTRKADYKAPKGKARVAYIRYRLATGECVSEQYVEFHNKKNIAIQFSKKPRHWNGT